MINARDLAAKAVEKVTVPPIPYLQGGRSAKGTDCINLVGWCVQQLGGKAADVPRGSNTAWRSVMQWTGTLDEARSQGRLIPGALVYIRDAPTAKWPDGDYGHAGVYVGKQAGWAAEQVIVHASASRGGVYPSTIKNAWTHVAWLECVDYAAKEVSPMPPDEPNPTGQTVQPIETYPALESATPIAVPAPPIRTASIPARLVVTQALRMREAPNSQGKYMLTIPGGSIVEAAAGVNGWYQTQWTANGRTYTGWISSDYTAPYATGSAAVVTPAVPPAAVPPVAIPTQPTVVYVTQPAPEKKPGLFGRIVSAIRGG
ncbi:MAG: SH3 domain-containing protein [Oscillospiraceae bacterium]|jgi:hypothetical protein|nr:SH3 domain-containing protein [Oscillospiraceae bacterium]